MIGMGYKNVNTCAEMFYCKLGGWPLRYLQGISNGFGLHVITGVN
jgi:hypothetical protein